MVCRSKIFIVDHLFTYIVQTCLAISVTEWPEDRKNRCLSVSKNSAGLHFHEKVQKIKENGKKKKAKIENEQNGQEKYGGKKLAFMHICGKTSKIL